ncbi:hypothetical protein [Nocardia carnea]|uniref:hypothetical protein n=1 Tax=Nocardia carnea TaxID=37328 RepID=UPI00245755C4|nr:hypothetical protein [Nocardia carnea]
MRQRLTSLASRVFTIHRTPAVVDRQVRVFLNRSRVAFAGYQPGAPLVLAFTFTLPTPRAINDLEVLDRVFAMFNDHPLHAEDQQHTRAWYDSGLRSLSVGDVVALDDRSYACASFSWHPETALWSPRL